MEQGSTTSEVADTGLFAGDAWFDPIEAGIRERIRGFIEELLEQEMTAVLGRGKSERAAGEPKGYRNGTRERQLLDVNQRWITTLISAATRWMFTLPLGPVSALINTATRVSSMRHGRLEQNGATISNF